MDNLLVLVGEPLLVLSSTLEDMVLSEPQELLLKLVREIEHFTQDERLVRYDEKIIALAKYIYCRILDEGIATTAWGSGIKWQQALQQATFPKEEKMRSQLRKLLRKLVKEEALNDDQLDLLELFYLASVWEEGLSEELGEPLRKQHLWVDKLLSMRVNFGIELGTLSVGEPMFTGNKNMLARLNWHAKLVQFLEGYGLFIGGAGVLLISWLIFKWNLHNHLVRLLNLL